MATANLIQITCCEKLQLKTETSWIGKLLRKMCCCGCCGRRAQPEVAYHDHEKRFLVLTIPPKMLDRKATRVEDFQNTDVYTFDESGVFVGVQGHHLEHWLHAETRASLTEQDVLGKNADVFAEPMRTTLRSIKRETLNGHALRVALHFLGRMYVLRTFPMYEGVGTGKVCGGTIILSPMETDLIPQLLTYRGNDSQVNQIIDESYNNSKEHSESDEDEVCVEKGKGQQPVRSAIVTMDDLEREFAAGRVERGKMSYAYYEPKPSAPKPSPK